MSERNANAEEDCSHRGGQYPEDERVVDREFHGGVRLGVMPLCMTQSVADDKQESSSSDGYGGNAQRE